MEYFMHIPPHDLGYLGPVSPNLTNKYPNAALT